MHVCAGACGGHDYAKGDTIEGYTYGAIEDEFRIPRGGGVMGAVVEVSVGWMNAWPRYHLNPIM